VAIATANPRPLRRGHVAPADTRPPPLRAGLIPRARLVRRLRKCRDVPLVLVVAPAGYGKSTLLAEWAAREDRPVACLSYAHRSDGLLDRALELLEDAAARDVPRVVVVDDAHRGSRAEIRRLADAASRLPPAGMLALASRREPPVAAARLRADRLVLDVTARELAMTRMEAAMLLDAAGARLDAAEVDLLMERTEGWPAALYLASRSLAEQPGAPDAIAGFTGADRLVAGYLRSEVLCGLTERRRSFLRRTSLLPRLTGPLCDAVVGDTGSAEALAALRIAGMPIETLDRQDVAFRYHPLLRAMLQAELARIEPALAPVLHRRAADWHSAHGEPEDALAHAVACRDADRAGRALSSCMPRYLADGRSAALARWLEPFGECEFAAHPALATAAAACRLAAGRRDLGEHLTDLAERAVERTADQKGAPAVAILRACIARDGIQRMGADAERACAIAAADSAWVGLGLYLAGVARHLTGDRPAARALLAGGAERAAAHVPLVAGLCHAQSALLAAECNAWDAVAVHAREAEAVVGDGAPAASRALVLAVGTVLAARAGELAQARHDAGDARRLLVEGPGFPAWLVAEALVWLARAEISLSDGPAARMLLARAAGVQAQVPGATVLADWVHDGWARADALAESATGDGPMLTNAELRVLRLLPSHLSFREIGARLQVSNNTIKTQALAVYRKLDVTCRSDAVERGRRSGLISG
jgi:LuxR family maltose regulon positive regulatory protein